jgi:hypothetical protein
MSVCDPNGIGQTHHLAKTAFRAAQLIMIA